VLVQTDKRPGDWRLPCFISCDYRARAAADSEASSPHKSHVARSSSVTTMLSPVKLVPLVSPVRRASTYRCYNLHLIIIVCPRLFHHQTRNGSPAIVRRSNTSKAAAAATDKKSPKKKDSAPTNPPVKLLLLRRRGSADETAAAATMKDASISAPELPSELSSAVPEPAAAENSSISVID